MDTIVQQYLATLNVFDSNYHPLSVHQKRNQMNEYNQNLDFEEFSNESSPVHDSSPSSTGGRTSEKGDPYDPMVKYISQMLMEEDDLENKPCMFHDCSALQAAEKSFYDVLNESKNNTSSVSGQENSHSWSNDSILTCQSHSPISSADVSHSVESSCVFNGIGFESSVKQSSLVNYASQSIAQLNLQSFSSTNSFLEAARELDDSLMNLIKLSDSSVKNQIDLKSWGKKGEVYGLLSNSNTLPKLDLDAKEKTSGSLAAVEENKSNSLPNGSSKKAHYREDNSAEERRSNKHLASYVDEVVPLELYDNVLLPPNLNPDLEPESQMFSSDEVLKLEAKNKLPQIEQSKASTRGRPRGGKRSNIKREVVDLRTLLVQCAEAVATYDSRTTNEQLKRIRQHASPYGDGVERLAYYFSNALEARLAGTGMTLYTGFRTRRISAADMLKGYQMYITACPLKKVSNIFANRLIRKLTSGATRLHIIDFGILYGYQWPCLIQRLSIRPGGPPKLRITGIDLPQPGLRPAERVEETGLRLKRYCERFNVPFEYIAIAKKWDTIQLKDFKIGTDELLVVNCLDRLANVPDETVMENSPRDAVLNLIKRIRPALFIHGVFSGTHNSPFFTTRFREALFYFSSLFDIFETTVPRENEERTLFEKEILGRDALNVIACEGTERFERPETYKQWQVRTLRAGFKQLPLDQEIAKRVRAKVKLHYHKEFSVDEDSNWLLQGWKGRVIHALSCWEPM